MISASLPLKLKLCTILHQTHPIYQRLIKSVWLFVNLTSEHGMIAILWPVSRPLKVCLTLPSLLSESTKAGDLWSTILLPGPFSSAASTHDVLLLFFFRPSIFLHSAGELHIASASFCTIVSYLLLEQWWTLVSCDRLMQNYHQEYKFQLDCSLFIIISFCFSFLSECTSPRPDAFNTPYRV